MGEACHYAVRISHLVFDSELRVYFRVGKKNYVVYRVNNGLWLETEGLKCKLLYFIVDGNVFSVITEGECRFGDEWTLLNKWEKEG